MKSLVSIGFFTFLFSLSVTAHSQSYFNNPESAVYDAVRDRYFISNVGSGDIVEISSAPDTSIFYTASPRVLGMIIIGDTLYATAASSVLCFDLAGDSLITSIPISMASDLNDITADTSGFLYMTDSYGQRVYKLERSSQTSSVIVTGIYWPNGILFDKENNRLLMCAFGSNAPIRAISLDGQSVTTLVSTSFTNLDGLTEDNAGDIYVSSWGSNAIYRYERTFTDPPVLVSDGHSGPADIYYDRVNDILVVPNFNSNTVDFIDMDRDEDGVLNVDDNCPDDYNPGQADDDDDGAGNECDLCADFDDRIDTDDDGVPDGCDNCPDVPGPCCEDADADGIGDACDNCPYHYNPDQADTNQNEIGDVCDFVCGDGNDDGSINLLDATFLIDYLYKDGPGPVHPEAADVDHSWILNLLDVTYLINFLYKDGADPDCPEYMF